MPKLEYFLVCESISVDRDTNRISLFNVIEEVHVAKTIDDVRGPALSNFVAVACWNRQEGDEGRDFQAMLRVYLPTPEDADDVEPGELTMNFRTESPRQRLLMRVSAQTIPFVPRGKLRFELLLNGEHCAEHEVAVIGHGQTSDDS